MSLGGMCAAMESTLLSAGGRRCVWCFICLKRQPGAMPVANLRGGKDGNVRFPFAGGRIIKRADEVIDEEMGSFIVSSSSGMVA